MKAKKSLAAAIALFTLIAVAGALSSCASSNKDDGMPHPAPTQDHFGHSFP